MNYKDAAYYKAAQNDRAFRQLTAPPTGKTRPITEDEKDMIMAGIWTSLRVIVDSADPDEIKLAIQAIMSGFVIMRYGSED